jgi:hypothetical protein
VRGLDSEECRPASRFAIEFVLVLSEGVEAEGVVRPDEALLSSSIMPATFLNLALIPPFEPVLSDEFWLPTVVALATEGRR